LQFVQVRLESDPHRRLRIVVAGEDTFVQDWLIRVVERAITEQWPSVAKEGERVWLCEVQKSKQL
jgi:hypothetical protein